LSLIMFEVKGGDIYHFIFLFLLSSYLFINIFISIFTLSEVSLTHSNLYLVSVLNYLFIIISCCALVLFIQFILTLVY